MAKTIKKRIAFTLQQPDASTVLLAGDFSQWTDKAIPLKRAQDGLWKATVSLEPGRYEYRFLVDGQWQDDPNCQARVQNAFGGENCVREVS